MKKMNGLLDRYEPETRKHEYMISNWNAYKMTDTKEDFIALINILDAHGESLDNLHDFWGNDTFCGIFFSDESDYSETINGLFEYNQFYTPETFPEFIQTMIDNGEFDGETPEEISENIREVLNDESDDTFVTRTTDGYVVTLYY